MRYSCFLTRPPYSLFRKTPTNPHFGAPDALPTSWKPPSPPFVTAIALKWRNTLGLAQTDPHVKNDLRRGFACILFRSNHRPEISARSPQVFYLISYRISTARPAAIPQQYQARAAWQAGGPEGVLGGIKFDPSKESPTFPPR